MPSLKLDDKIAVVTGGTSGIGRGIALALAEAGADVVPVSRTKEKVDKTVEEIRGLGRCSLSCPVDVAKRDDVEDMFQVVTERLGSIDILVNSAGVLVKKPFLELTEKDWDYVMDINVRGIFNTCQVVGREMIRREEGKVINIASLASFFGLTGSSAYCASKGAVLQITRSLAVEWSAHNINVNAIAPGFLKTNLNAHLFEQNTEFKTNMEARIPNGRIGKVEDIAGAALFLASDLSDYLNGETIVVDGGFAACGA